MKLIVFELDPPEPGSEISGVAGVLARWIEVVFLYLVVAAIGACVVLVAGADAPVPFAVAFGLFVGLLCATEVVDAPGGAE